MKRLLLGLALTFGLAFAAWAEDPTSAVATDADPYLWLEDVESSQALDWVRARNTASTTELAETPEFKALQQRLLSILNSDARIPMVKKMGKYYYNHWKDAEHPRGIWRRTTLEEYKKPNPAWETIIDVDALGKAEGVSWVWDGANCLQPKYERCLVALSRGGADATEVREFDLKNRVFLADGFHVPEAKTDIGWIDQDTVFIGTDMGPGTLTNSGYARQVRRWQRGTPLDQSELVYEVKQDDVWTVGWHDNSRGVNRSFIQRGITFFTSEMLIEVDGQWVKLDKPDDASASVWQSWLLVEPRTDWVIGDKTWPAGGLMAIDLEKFLAGDRNFEILFQPTETSSLAGWSTTKSTLLLNTLDNVRSKIEVLRPGKKGWTHAPLQGVPSLGTVNAWGVDPDKSDDFMMTVTDYITPTTLYMGRVGKGAPVALKSLPAFFNAEGLELTQHQARSLDGTQVPYFQVSRKGMNLDGKNPTLLYGYGGFEVSLVPNYSGTVGAAWLEPGGTFVVANIRGGGEFGPRWHQAALKANRNKAYEDFAAVAQDLAARGVADAQHLGIQGGSNGGLLMGNMFTSYPTLFKAVVCQVPLLDMWRCNKVLAGASWMGEYGDPDKPEEWAFLQKYSPYHKVQAGVDYPRVLFMTSTRDDRVHPGHARKMAARMLEQGHDLLYYENIEGGHGGSADNTQASFMGAMAYSFLWSELKP